jgi:hypothetical protein
MDDVYGSVDERGEERYPSMSLVSTILRGRDERT